MSANASIAPYRDRSGVLSLIGILLLLFGVGCAALAPAELVCFYWFSEGGRFHYPGFGAAFVLVNYSALAVAPFHRVDLALLALPASLVLAGLITAAVRGGAAARWLVPLLTTILVVGLMWVYACGISGQWALTRSLFATRVVQVSVIGLLGPAVLAWLLEVQQPAGVGFVDQR